MKDYSIRNGSGAAHAAAILVEVPVMLSVVRITTATKGWSERGLPAAHKGALAHPRR